MPDIRNFFGPKGGAAPQSRSRKHPSRIAKPSERVLDDSDDEPVESPTLLLRGQQSCAAGFQKQTTSYRDYNDDDDDDDAYMDDGDEDADDIHAADMKSRSKRRNDDYMDDESEDDLRPKPKRVASRGSALRATVEVKSTPPKKRKSPEPESESEEEAPRKKAAPARPRAPRATKAANDDEDPNIQKILDDIPTTVDREVAQALVKKYDGKVTGQPSGKTDFVVLGEDAGPSKLAKIKALGIKTINEEGLFDLIRRLPAHGGSGKGAEKARQKKEEEASKAKQQAVEMEREENARKAEADKIAKAAAASRGLAAPAPPQAAQLWTTKYAPAQLSHICGNKSNVEKIQNWLNNWQKSKKYDFQRRAAKLAGYDILESNASDTRSKRLVEEGLSDAMDNTSLRGYFAGDGKTVDSTKKKMVLIMDEVDGMSAGDRGGVAALAKFCKKTEVPLILICNERRLPKMKPFDHVALDIKFQRPTVDQVRSRVMTICHREGLKLAPQVINALIEGCNKDIRQIVNMLSTIRLDQSSIDFDQTKSMTKAWEKHVILKPWDICQKMLGGGLFAPSSTATLNDKIGLYFNDHEFSYLMIQENYLKTKPALLNGKGYSPREAKLKALELVDKAAESISDGDLVDRMIHGPQQHWSLMPAHAVFSTVRPASYISGQLLDSGFTSWLGNNSKQNKLGRNVREIHSHMRLRASGDHTEIRQHYLPTLWNATLKRLAVEGREAVDEVIELMDSYYLTREDLDFMTELGLGPQQDRPGMIDTQVKSHFTRTYNGMSHPLPFMKASTSVAAPKKPKEVPDLEEAVEEDDDADVAEPEPTGGDDELDLKGDKYIKKPKPKAKKPAKKKAAKNDDDEDEQPKARDNDEEDEDEGHSLINAELTAREDPGRADQLPLLNDPPREPPTFEGFRPRPGPNPTRSGTFHFTFARMAQLNLLKELRAGAHKNGLLYPREFREAAEKKRTREKIRRTIQRQFDELQYRHAYLTRAVGTHRRDARAAAADMEALEQEIRKEVLAAGYSSIDGMMEATATLQRGLTRQLRNSPEMVGGANTAPSVEKSSLLCLSIC
ncbi:unnamed protein product [Parascedosporium putredinis]|uniref:Replication factor C subunit 1 n=1 Tax=Parascedosporium putredinis TaxID=1442378 RepID=A0A9P1H7A0_9PEZI|nr:unnamed protein product [Parascedosporium putredinis]CAI7999651.1 unnamed protein product [Parascedosporium putredinis]